MTKVLIVGASHGIGREFAICVSLHPGWVRTDMGAAAADLAVADSVADMRRLLASLSTRDNGRFFNHDGTVIAW